ncbi:MAG: hypothetical protein QOI42_1438, partial [Frankiaceae bacterium]|nr:hypothetical protein [Frankiaceae bacterium]
MVHKRAYGVHLWARGAGWRSHCTSCEMRAALNP